MTVFLDSNIILDILLKNEELYKESQQLLNLADNHKIDFFISATSVTDIFYIVNKKIKNREKTKEHIKLLLELVSIAGIDEACIKNALNSSWNDFEDAVQHESSVQIQADYLVTRNTKDFKTSFVEVITPGDFLKRFAS
ncbi:MAG: PIN domain-containing protein [Spirochaetaceae bacterium]|nr:PIN domain-containing protein [Spirochaetaceae bacterium]